MLSWVTVKGFQLIYIKICNNSRSEWVGLVGALFCSPECENIITFLHIFSIQRYLKPIKLAKNQNSIGENCLENGINNQLKKNEWISSEMSLNQKEIFKHVHGTSNFPKFVYTKMSV